MNRQLLDGGARSGKRSTGTRPRNGLWPVIPGREEPRVELPAILAVTAAMVIDGDTVRTPGANIRLTGEGNVPFDTPETWRPECRSEAKLGAQATGHVRAMMPGEVCIIGRGAGGYGRDLGILYGSDGREVREGLMERGLAVASKNADWCD